LTVLRLNQDTLARTRFALSPMAEVVAALTLLSGCHSPPPVALAWVRAHSRAFNAMLTEPVLAALVTIARSGNNYLPDFMTPTPPGMSTTFAEQFAGVAATPGDKARSDLAYSAGGPLPTALDRPDVAQHVADALATLWAQFIEPGWPGIRAALQRDVVQRAGWLATCGWAHALGGLNGSIRWLGEGRLEVNKHASGELDVGEAELLLIPCSLGIGWICIDPSRAYAIVYPARGIAARFGGRSPGGLDRLIGATRAAVLRSLAVPASTSQLVAQLGLSLGTVGDHLAALRDAGAVASVRTGRSVLYHQTELGRALTDQDRRL
jgi:DNA-binding transcriptional ArsR family regulator